MKSSKTAPPEEGPENLAEDGPSPPLVTSANRSPSFTSPVDQAAPPPKTPGIAQAFPQILAHRDMLFVDQRGTGGSHPLDCKFYDRADLQTYLGYFFPLDDVRKCREELEPIRI